MGAGDGAVASAVAGAPYGGRRAAEGWVLWWSDRICGEAELSRSQVVPCSLALGILVSL